MARNFTKLVLKTPPVTPSAAYISNGGCNKSAGRSSTPHTQIRLSEREGGGAPDGTTCTLSITWVRHVTPSNLERESSWEHVTPYYGDRGLWCVLSNFTVNERTSGWEYMDWLLFKFRHCILLEYWQIGWQRVLHRINIRTTRYRRVLWPHILCSVESETDCLVINSWLVTTSWRWRIMIFSIYCAFSIL